MKTRIANLYKENYDVYIGRAGKGKDGYFGNPFKGMSKTESIALFKKYFHKRLKDDPTFNKKVRELKGKVLGCFCSPKPCHGDVIVEYLNSIPEDRPVKLAIICSKSFSDYDFMNNILKWFCIETIIVGDLKEDSYALRYAEENGIRTIKFPSSTVGQKRLVDECDEIVAFWDGCGGKLKAIMEIAEASGKPVSTYWPDKKSSITEDEISML